MEKDIIESHVSSLPFLEEGTELTDELLWEGTEDGASFKVTRNVLPGITGFGILGLTISGEHDSRNKIVNEFSDVYGAPADYNYDENQGYPIETYAWIQKID